MSRTETCENFMELMVLQIDPEPTSPTEPEPDTFDSSFGWFN